MSLGIAWMAALVGITNFGEDYLVRGYPFLDAVLTPNVSTEILMATFFGLARFLPERIVQLVQTGLILLLSGPMMLSNAYSFFGMWFFVLGTILLYKYGLLRRRAIWKVSLLLLYFLPFLVASVIANEGVASSFTRVFQYSVFLSFCLIFLYFIFETNIRELMKNNGQKELALAERELEIARMEPLSVLGERVAHVTHSFKNNLAELHSIADILEDSGDAREGARLLAQVTQRLDERIENILMVSRAGVDLEPETFDVARVLEGMKFVYLTDPSVARSVWNEITLRGPVVIRAVRWDFILMVENILKNALEAIQARSIRGTVRIDLTAGLLTISNNGGAMELCSACLGNCLDCSVYGRPGKTTKVGGSGHGLAQVFATCRKNGWALRIRTDEDWTLIQILLGDPRQVAAPEAR
jgi:signal transduction histidine kinase